MGRFTIWGMAWLGFSSVAVVSAQDEGLGISGLLIDDTRTRQGHEFFDVFSVRFQQVEGLPYTISINEFTDGRRGSFIVVKVDDNQVFMERLNPLQEFVEASAQRAVARVAAYLIQKIVLQQNLEEEMLY